MSSYNLNSLPIMTITERNRKRKRCSQNPTLIIRPQDCALPPSNFCFLPGNLLTVVALLQCPKLRSHATTLFVISLAASDLLFCAVNLPLTAARYIHREWTLGPVTCR